METLFNLANLRENERLLSTPFRHLSAIEPSPGPDGSPTQGRTLSRVEEHIEEQQTRTPPTARHSKELINFQNRLAEGSPPTRPNSPREALINTPETVPLNPENTPVEDELFVVE